MRVLVLHTRFSLTDRGTFSDSLYSFKRYYPNAKFTYVNVKRAGNITRGMQKAPFDAIIMHYTFLAKRQNREKWPNFYRKILPKIQAMRGCKVMIPQDEYYFTASLQDMIRDLQVDYVFTNADEENTAKLYPRSRVGDKVRFIQVFPGYVDEIALRRMEKISQTVDRRNIDLGYRGMKLPYCFGSHGQLKTHVAEVFETAIPHHPLLRTDIDTTGVRQESVLLGDQWLEFLLRSRVTLGCLGGSSLLVEDDTLFGAIAEYVCSHPNASFDETAQSVFPGQDGYIDMQLLSPKFFECAMAKSCLLLVEGNYYGVFLPGVHYIEVKRDFSNIDQVLTQIEDHAYCRKIAQRCYDDIVAPRGKENPYTYAAFAHMVMEYVCDAVCAEPPLRPTGLLWRLDLGCRNFLKGIQNGLKWSGRRIASIFCWIIRPWRYKKIAAHAYTLGTMSFWGVCSHLFYKMVQLFFDIAYTLYKKIFRTKKAES